MKYITGHAGGLLRILGRPLLVPAWDRGDLRVFIALLPHAHGPSPFLTFHSLGA